jgi:Cadherin domain
VDFEKFSIDRRTGVIRTTSSFDREQKNEYYITVVAEDGAPSARPNHYPPGTPNQGTLIIMQT